MVSRLEPSLAKNPKPLVGYSDITALHVAIRQRTGLATIYGNGLSGVGAPDVTAFSKERLLSVLRGGGAGEVPGNPDDSWLRTIRGGRVTAPLVGGCLWLLMQTMIDYAGSEGLQVIEGQVLRDNTTMLTMCRELGFEIAADPQDTDLCVVKLRVPKRGQ